MYTVYELVDQRDELPFYVGITVDVYSRFSAHVHCDGTNPEKDERIQGMKAANVMMVMRTLEQVEGFEQARHREQWWIRHYIAAGINLTNIVTPRIKQVSEFPVRPIAENMGRERNFAATIEMLVVMRETGKWPQDVSLAMQRYYKRRYPEFFSNGQKWAKMREEKMQKASLSRKQDRPSRRRKPIKSA